MCMRSGDSGGNKRIGALYRKLVAAESEHRLDSLAGALIGLLALGSGLPHKQASSGDGFPMHSYPADNLGRYVVFGRASSKFLIVLARIRRLALYRWRNVPSNLPFPRFADAWANQRYRR